GADVFELSVSSAVLSIADVLWLEGSLSYVDLPLDGGTAQTVAATGLTIFFGDGPYTLAGGDRNPLARGLLLTNATVGLIRMAGKFALDAHGLVQVIGLDGVVATGDVHVRVNSFGHGFTQTLTIPGTS